MYDLVVMVIERFFVFGGLRWFVVVDLLKVGDVEVLRIGWLGY